jgi:hypothetical protein
MRPMWRIMAALDAVMIMCASGLVTHAAQNDGICWGSAPTGTSISTAGMTWG